MKAKGVEKSAKDLTTGLKRWRLTILVMVVMLAVAWRFVGITQWPSSFHLTRQYDDALRARAMWLKVRPQPLSDGERLWLEHSPSVVLEVPLLESLMVGSYLMAGGEYPWLAYVITSCCWLAGGWFIYDMARRLTSSCDSALLALAIYLLAPLGIMLSRSFQPEAPLVLGLVVALWSIIRWQDSTTWRTTFLVGSICGLAMLVKPGFAFFPLLGTYVALRLSKAGWRAVIGPQTWVFAALTLVPSVIYVWLFLSGQGGQKIMPHLLLTADYYRTWWLLVSTGIGWYLLAAAVAGAYLLKRDNGSYVGYGLLAGYGAFCATFTWHTMTHSYYHVILVPIVALCAAPLGGYAGAYLTKKTLPKWLPYALAAALLTVLIGFSSPALTLIAPPEGFDDAIKFHQEFGRFAGAGSKTAFLGEDYGQPLAFHGWLSVYAWPTHVDLTYNETRGVPNKPAAQRLREVVEDFKAQYFVVTNLEELKNQPELAELLKHLPRVVEGPQLVVFDLRPIGAPRVAPSAQ